MQLLLRELQQEHGGENDEGDRQRLIEGVQLLLDFLGVARDRNEIAALVAEIATRMTA